MIKKSILLIAGMAVIIVALAIIALWPMEKVQGPQENVKGLSIDSIKIGDTVYSPLQISGEVSGNGWNGFEGQVGTVQLLDADGKQIAMGILEAKTDWMQPTVKFETTLIFTSSKEQSGKLVFHNENPSGMNDKAREFVLPVKIPKALGEATTVKVFFNNNKMDPDYSCNKVFAVERQVIKVPSMAMTALVELLKGPSETEKNAGFFTSMNAGVKIQNLKIENGTAYVDFSSRIEEGVGGSCKVSAIRAEITETLKQFSTVKNIVISVNGRTEDILQP